MEGVVSVWFLLVGYVIVRVPALILGAGMAVRQSFFVAM